MKRALWIITLVLIMFPSIVFAETGANAGVKNRVEISEQRIKDTAALKLKYQENLQKLKDQKKKVMLLNLTDKLCRVNKDRTNTMTSHLTRMGEILGKVVFASTELKSRGKDTAGVEQAVEIAKAKITTAMSVVSTQAAASCLVNISGKDATVGAEVRNSLSVMQASLQNANKAVAEARKATAEAITALARLRGDKYIPKLKEGTY